jgi:hypothetical protein
MRREVVHLVPGAMNRFDVVVAAERNLKIRSASKNNVPSPFRRNRIQRLSTESLFVHVKEF